MKKYKRFVYERKTKISYIPGSGISCQTDGSVKDCILCRISLSNGSGGWKSSDRDMDIPIPSELSKALAAEPRAEEGAKGSTPPIGANWSNDKAVLEGGGDSV